MMNEKWRNRFSRWLKLRFAILYPLGLWALIQGYATNASLARGLWLIVLGLAVRSWANCYAIKMAKLTTSGPYGHVRHPLYLGSFLILSGFLITVNINWIGVLFAVIVVIGIVYKQTVQNEERMLTDKFGQEYVDYKKAVPAFFPRVFTYRGGQKWPPSISRYFRSQEYKLVIWISVLVIFFRLKERLFIDKQGWNTQMIIWGAVAVGLIITDLIAEVFRQRAKKTSNI